VVQKINYALANVSYRMLIALSVQEKVSSKLITTFIIELSRSGISKVILCYFLNDRVLLFDN